MTGARFCRIALLAVGVAGAAGCGGMTRVDVHAAIDEIEQRAVALRYHVDYLAAGRPFRLARLSPRGRTLDHFDPKQGLGDWDFKSVTCWLYVDYPVADGQRDKARVQVWVDVRGDQASKTMRPPNMFMAIITWPVVAIQGLTGTDYWTTFDHHEHWQMDISKSEVTDLLESLLAEGLFDRTYRSSGQAWVRVWLDRSWSTRYWDPIPPLERLIERVRTRGELRSLTRTPGSPLDKLRTPAAPGIESSPPAIE